MKVLIVDDTTFMRTTIRRFIDELGSNDVVEAENGLDAVTKYKIHKPDLVIMDISMPVMDGIEAVKLIKAYDPLCNIIICSLQGQRNNVMEAIKSGARSFLVKPIKREKLMAEIAKLPAAVRQGSSSESTSEIHPEAIGDLAPEEMDARIAEKLGELKTLTDSFDEEKNSEAYLKGVEEGYLEARREIATNMIRMGIDLEVVKSCVEISDEDIETFKIQYKLD